MEIPKTLYFPCAMAQEGGLNYVRPKGRQHETLSAAWEMQSLTDKTAKAR